MAVRRTRALLECGARITVVSPAIDDTIYELAVEVFTRRWKPKDLGGAFLAIAATDDQVTNSQVVAECRKRRILCNNAETPDAGDFVVPSTARRGDLLLAVTTGGASPALSRQIRDELFSAYGPEYGPYIELLRELRESVLHNIEDPSRRRDILTNAVEDAFALQLIRENRIQEARDRLFQCISTSSD